MIIPKIWENKIDVPNHQPVVIFHSYVSLPKFPRGTFPFKWWDEPIPINNFLENEIHHWDPTQVRYPTQVRCLTSYKQPLRQSAAKKMAMIADLDKFNVLRLFFGCVVLLPRPIFLIILEMSLHTNPV